jgi:hypothetical protein
MGNFKLCELGIVMNPFAIDERIRERLAAHHETCPNHERYPMKRKRVHKAVVTSKCGPRCSNQGGKHWCPPSGMGNCAVFKGQYMDGLKDFLVDPKAWR